MTLISPHHAGFSLVQKYNQLLRTAVRRFLLYSDSFVL